MDPQSPIQHPIYNGICPGAPIKHKTRTTTPPPRGKPNGICYCPLDDCKCHYAPKRPRK